MFFREIKETGRKESNLYGYDPDKRLSKSSGSNKTTYFDPDKLIGWNNEDTIFNPDKRI